MSYADIDQLAARWRPLTDEEVSTAEVLLEDAAVQIRAEIPDLTARIEAGNTDLLAAAIRVECAMVKRAMQTPDVGIGLTSLQETQGPFSHTFQYANPSGDLYLTKAEKRLLGAGGQRAFTVSMGGEEAPWILDRLADVKAASPNSVGLSGFEA